MATQQEYDDILRYKTAAAGTVKKYREDLALALALYTNITDFLLGGSFYPGVGAFVLGQVLQGKIIPLGRELPESSCPGGGHVL